MSMTRICLRGKCEKYGYGHKCCMYCEDNRTCNILGRCTEDDELSDLSKCSKIIYGCNINK